MRSSFLIASVLLLTSICPTTTPAQTETDSPRLFPGARIVWGVRGGPVQMQGNFRNTVGARHGGFQATVAVRGRSGIAVGLQIGGSELQDRSETATLESGLNVNLKTTTSLTRVGIFGQYGPRLGPVRPYAEGLLGIHVATTDTKIPDSDTQTDNTKTHEESVAPAAGLALGLEVGLYKFGSGSVALRLEGRHTYGGTVDYLYYSPDAGEFVEASSGSTTSGVSVGITLNY